jgi:hypothetical protein
MPPPSSTSSSSSPSDAPRVRPLDPPTQCATGRRVALRQPQEAGRVWVGVTLCGGQVPRRLLPFTAV